MGINANSVRVGNVIEHQGGLWRVAKTQHTMPGKGGAFVQMELKSLTEGTKQNTRFRSSEDIEVARLDDKEFSYLYEEGDMIALMDGETYEQISIPRDLLGEQEVYLQDGMILTLQFHESNIVSATVPESVTLEVAETEAVIKGQTAANSNKPAVMENGVRVMVPPFISVGDRLIVKTADNSYVERAKD